MLFLLKDKYFPKQWKKYLEEFLNEKKTFNKKKIKQIYLYI
jgi:hypothetical protein